MQRWERDRGREKRYSKVFGLCVFLMFLPKEVSVILKVQILTHIFFFVLLHSCPVSVWKCQMFTILFLGGGSRAGVPPYNLGGSLAEQKDA